MSKTEMKREQELNQAAHTLSNNVWDIADKLRKSCVLLQEISEEYFQKYDSTKKENQFSILWEFRRSGTIVEMIYDYIVEAKKLTEALEERAQASGVKEAV